MALYEISMGNHATQVALKTHRNPQTVMQWVHNAVGTSIQLFKSRRYDLSAQWWSPIPLSKSVESGLDQLIRIGNKVAKTPPQKGVLPPQPGVDFKKISYLGQNSFQY